MQSMTNLIAQILGILALVTSIICYQFNSQKKILIAQIVASVLFTVNLALLGGMSGALLNIHGICRALTFYAVNSGNNKSETSIRARSRFWAGFYVLAAFICTAVTYQSPLDILPLIGQSCTTVAYSMKDPAKIRRLTLPSPPCWFVYHLSQGNIGGTLNEIFVIASILIGMFRFDRKSANS